MTKEEMLEIGRRIANQRKLLDIPQGILASDLCVDPATVSRWENGKMAPSEAHLRELARYLKVSVQYLQLQTNNPLPTDLAKEMPELDQKDYEAVRLFMELPEYERKVIRRIIMHFYDDHQNSWKE